MPSTFTIPAYANASTYPEQAKPDPIDFSVLAGGTSGVGVISGCAVAAQGTPDMTLAVTAGMVTTGAGVQITVASGNVTVTTAHATLPRWDLVVVSSAGTKSVVAGTAASTPLLPSPGSACVLAAVYVPATVTAITNAMLVDKRVTQATSYQLVTGLVENSSSAATANTAAIQAALNSAAAAASARANLSPATGTSTGGTRVVIPAGRYYINRSVGSDTTCCLLLGNSVVLAGQGLGTQLILANGVASAATPCVMVKAALLTNFVGIEDISLLGNKSNQTDTNSASHGVDFSRGTITELYDGMFWLTNVFVFEAAGNGFNLFGVANTVKAIGCRESLTPHHHRRHRPWRHHLIAATALCAHDPQPGRLRAGPSPQ
jgi:hypothetical protein